MKFNSIKLLTMALNNRAKAKEYCKALREIMEHLGVQEYALTGSMALYLYGIMPPRKLHDIDVVIPKREFSHIKSTSLVTAGLYIGEAYNKLGHSTYRLLGRRTPPVDAGILPNEEYDENTFQLHLGDWNTAIVNLPYLYGAKQLLDRDKDVIDSTLMALYNIWSKI